MFPRRAAVTLGLAVLLTLPTASVSAATPNLSSPASELRVTLGRLLSEHVFLTVEQMRSAASSAPDLEAVAELVEANTRDLESAIASIYGAQAGTRFGQLWRSHIAFFVDYARASAAGDEAGKRKALDSLPGYRDDLSRFLAGANRNLTSEGAAELLQLHVDQVTAYIGRDYDRAFATEREAYRHMFSTGDVLARAIVAQFPEKFTGNELAFSPAVSLWLTLDRLLGEHMILSAEAMRAGREGGAAFEAAGRALDANSADLGRAVGSIYGAEAGRAFDRLWRSHLDSYVGYVAAVTAGDEAAKAQRRQELDAYGKSFGDFIAKANPNLTSEAVAGLIRHHTDALLAQVDAYAAQDYRKAYAQVREAYSHLFTVGQALATAIVAQFPKAFPMDLPLTDTSPRESTPVLPSLPLLALLAVSVSVVLIQREVFARRVR